MTAHALAVMAITLLTPQPSAAAPSPTGSRTVGLLSVGEPAPRLSVERWVKGREPLRFGSGSIYVIEFWATWCGPCVAAIPQLTALQRRFQADSVIVVGCTSRDAWGNTFEAVQAFVNRKADRMGYSIAWLPDSKPAKGPIGIHVNPWYLAAGVGYMPCAFVVDRDGRIAYIGDPGGAEAAVAALVAGRFDRQAAVAAYAARFKAKALLDTLESSLKRGDTAVAVRTARELVAGPSRDDAHSMMVVGIIVNAATNASSAELIQVATEAAERAVSLTERRAPGMLDVLAHLHFRAGAVQKAIQIEEEALALSEGEFHEAQLRELEGFRKAAEER